MRNGGRWAQRREAARKQAEQVQQQQQLLQAQQAQQAEAAREQAQQAEAGGRQVRRQCAGRWAPGEALSIAAPQRRAPLYRGSLRTLRRRR